MYAWVGAYARYVADDYCWAGVLRIEGFWPAQVAWYTGYSPRYAFTFLVNLAELAGPAVVPLLPTVALVTWLTSLVWCFSQFGLRLRPALILGEVAVLAVLHTAPDLGQSLYWQTGMLTYLLPLILATLFVGLVVRAERRPSVSLPTVVVCAALTYVAGGLSETYLIPQNVALTLVTVAALVYRRSALPYIVTGLAGGVLALATILIAPATASRVGGSPADLWLALSASIAAGAYQALRLVRYFPHIVALCLALPALLQLPSRAPDGRRLGLVTAAVAFTLPFCYFPSFYAQNGNPPARSLIVPGAILIGYLAFLGVALGPYFGARVPTAGRWASVAALLAVPLGVAVTTFPDGARAADYAAQWDAEDALIRSARDSGQRELVVPPLPPNLGEDFVTADPKHFLNVCVARYYGVDTIAASAPTS